MKFSHLVLLYLSAIGLYSSCVYFAIQVDSTTPDVIPSAQGPHLMVVPGSEYSADPDMYRNHHDPDTKLSAQEPFSRFPYIKITDGCDPHFQGGCVNVRSGPSTDHPVIAQLRSGVVLRASEKIAENDREWYRVIFDEWLRYPDRLASPWFVAAEYVEAFENEGTLMATDTSATTTKSIIVDRSEQKLYAYDDTKLFMEELVSTGNELTPTPRGTFSIFRKTPSRYMQGPLPEISDDYYDLPGVPWNLYFTSGGAAIHGTYWHDKFGQPWSHGCVNLPPDIAERLYHWADIGTQVTVRD